MGQLEETANGHEDASRVNVMGSLGHAAISGSLEKRPQTPAYQGGACRKALRGCYQGSLPCQSFPELVEKLVGRVCLILLRGGEVQITGEAAAVMADHQQTAFHGPTGQSVVGYRRYWKLGGNQRGAFSYQNTSMNSPWNTMSDSIYIQ